MYIATKCPDCEKSEDIHVDEQGYALWKRGVLIQDALPTLPASQREQLLTGICHDCFEAMFPPEPGECCGLCITAGAVGVSSHNGRNVADEVAYAYPGCPAHDPDGA